jgi:hypothetical protein
MEVDYNGMMFIPSFMKILPLVPNLLFGSDKQTNASTHGNNGAVRVSYNYVRVCLHIYIYIVYSYRVQTVILGLKADGVF